MNKRQIKKRKKIVKERLDYFTKGFTIRCGRQNGKTSRAIAIYKACTHKKYKYFKILKKRKIRM